MLLWLKKAPLAIVVCGDMTKALAGGGREFWVQDASAATENILLAAHALGLGAVWTGTYPSKDRSAKVAELLKMPDTLIPLNTIVIGYPAENPAPKDKWNPQNISYNFYGGKEGWLCIGGSTTVSIVVTPISLNG
jgi:nitroreductase